MAYADFVFRNGNVFTSGRANPIAEALAVVEDRIVAVGEVSEFIGPSTEVVDLRGALVAPGFIDAHVHVATSGLDKLRVSFDGCDNASEAVAHIAQYSTVNPEAPWIIGAGWSQSWFEKGCPSAQLLDEVVPDRPVLVMNRDGHSAWVNTRALEIGGVNEHTLDPPDGRIERLGDGSPQGTLHEGAVELVERHTPNDTVEDFVTGIVRGQEEMFSYGITGWQEAAVIPEVQSAYLRVARSGELKGDVVGALWWDRHRGLEQVEELIERRKEAASGFRPTAVKLMLDGVAENFTASLLSSYLDGSGSITNNTGVNFIDPQPLKEIVTQLDRFGFQCHFHALGDGAVRSALDAVAAALATNGPSRNRHHLAHLQFVHPDDIPRFAELNATANVQPLWACMEDYQTELTRPYVTRERFSWQYPFRSLVDSGARLAMGSDWSVSTANVMEEIAVAITRKAEDDGEALGIGEAISPEAALTAFTLGSAYVNHCEKETGSLQVGKRADLAILDRNPFADGSFRDAKVAMTFAGGTPVYEA